MQNRRAQLLSLAEACVVVILTLFSAREAMLFIERHSAKNNVFEKQRLNLMHEALSRIVATNQPVILAFGASDFETSFDPRVFDQRLASHGFAATSYNLAIRNSHLIQSQWIQQVADAFINARKRPLAVIVKYSPSRLTRASVKSFANISPDLESAMLDAHVFSKLWRPGSAHLFTLWLDKNLWAGMSPGLAAGFVQRWLDFGASGYRTSNESPYLFSNQTLNQDLLDWDLKSRGYFHFGWPETSQAYQRAISQYTQMDRRREVLNFHIRCCDILNLDFDLPAVQAFEDSLRVWQKLGVRVFIAHVPDSPGLERGVQTKVREHMLLERIARATDATILSDEDLVESDYLDPVHLTREAGHSMSLNLADRLYAALSEAFTSKPSRSPRRRCC